MGGRTCNVRCDEGMKRFYKERDEKLVVAAVGRDVLMGGDGTRRDESAARDG